MKFNLSKTCRFITLLVIISMVLMLSPGTPVKPLKINEARAFWTFTNFGGPVLVSIFCICSANFWTFIGPPKGGVFMYQPGITQLFAWWAILQPGAWTMGAFFPFGTCVQYIGIACVPLPAEGTMALVGTSP